MSPGEYVDDTKGPDYNTMNKTWEYRVILLKNWTTKNKNEYLEKSILVRFL